VGDLELSAWNTLLSIFILRIWGGERTNLDARTANIQPDSRTAALRVGYRHASGRDLRGRSISTSSHHQYTSLSLQEVLHLHSAYTQWVNTGKKRLSYSIQNPIIMWVKINRKVRTIEFLCLSVCFVKDVFPSTSKCGRGTSL
jgi:hypothetical protein